MDDLRRQLVAVGGAHPRRVRRDWFAARGALDVLREMLRDSLIRMSVLGQQPSLSSLTPGRRLAAKSGQRSESSAGLR
jgi:hypothetical protein